MRFYKYPLHTGVLVYSIAAIAEPHRLLLHAIFCSVQVLGLTASPGGDVDVVSFFTCRSAAMRCRQTSANADSAAFVGCDALIHVWHATHAFTQFDLQCCMHLLHMRICQIDLCSEWVALS